MSCFGSFDDSDNDSEGAFEPQPSVNLSLKVHGNSRKRLCSSLEDDEFIERVIDIFIKYGAPSSLLN